MNTTPKKLDSQREDGTSHMPSHPREGLGKVQETVHDRTKGLIEGPGVVVKTHKESINTSTYQPVVFRAVLLRHLVKKPFSNPEDQAIYDKGTALFKNREPINTEEKKEIMEKFNQLDDKADVYSFAEMEMLIAQLEDEMGQSGKLSPKKQELYNEIKKTLELYDDIFRQGKEDMVFALDQSGKKRRNLLSANEVKSRYDRDPHVMNVTMDGSRKEEDRLTRHKAVIQEMHTIWGQMKSGNWKKGKAHDPDSPTVLIIFGNRVYAGSFMEIRGDWEVSDKDLSDRFEHEGYFSMDFVLGSDGELLPVKHDPTTFFVRSSDDICEIATELGQINPNMFALVDIATLDHIQLQNHVNATISTFDPETKRDFFQKLMTSGHEEFRVCALANLFETNIAEAIAFVRPLYKDNQVSFSILEEEFLLKHITKKEVRELYRDLYGSGHTNKITDRDMIDVLNELRLLQENSLDERIKNHEVGALLQRNITWIEKKTEEKEVDGKKVEKIIEITHTADFDDIIEGKDFPSNTIVLPAHVGSGKTMWLTDFILHVMDHYPNKKVVFLKGSDVKLAKGDQILDNLDRIIKDESGEYIVCIDAIDEVDFDSKVRLKTLIATNVHHRFVITSRPSEYNEKENVGMVTLQMEPVSKDEYLKSRILDEALRNKIDEKLKTSNLAQQVEGNPLLLNFICILAREDTDPELQKIRRTCGVKSLDEILNKADLYENIAKLVIIQHNYTKDIKVDLEEIEDVLSLLGELAYKLSNKKAIEIPKYKLQKLALFLKKSETTDGKDEQYEFIHYSFHEYFLARHLANLPNGEGVIYSKREEWSKGQNWGKWRSFSPVVVYFGEILWNSVLDDMGGQGVNMKINRLEQFLGMNSGGDIDASLGILANDDLYGEGMLMLAKMLCGFSKGGGGEKQDALYRRVVDGGINSLSQELLNDLEIGGRLEGLLIALSWHENNDRIFRLVRCVADKIVSTQCYNDILGFAIVLARYKHDSFVSIINECIDLLPHSQIYVDGVREIADGAMCTPLFKRCIHYLFEAKDYYRIGFTLAVNIKILDEDLIYTLRDCIEALVLLGRIDLVELIYSNLSDNKHVESPYRKLQDGNCWIDQFEELDLGPVRIGDVDMMPPIRLMARNFHEKGDIASTIRIIMFLIREGDRDMLDLLESCLISIMKTLYAHDDDIDERRGRPEEFSYLDNIILGLIQTRDSSLIPLIEKCLRILHYFDDNHIYYTLIELPEIVFTKEYISLMKTGVSHLKTRPIFAELAKQITVAAMNQGEVDMSGDLEDIIVTRLNGKMELGDMDRETDVISLVATYLDFVGESGMLKAKEYIGALVLGGHCRGFCKHPSLVPIVRFLVNEQASLCEYGKAAKLAFDAIDAGQTDLLPLAKHCIQSLYNMSEFDLAGSYAVRLVKMGQSDMAVLAKQCIRDLCGAGAYYEASMLVLDLVRVGDDEMLPLLMEVRDKIEIWGLFQFFYNMIRIYGEGKICLVPYIRSHLSFLIEREPGEVAGMFYELFPGETSTAFPEEIMILLHQTVGMSQSTDIFCYVLWLQQQEVFEVMDQIEAYIKVMIQGKTKYEISDLAKKLSKKEGEVMVHVGYLLSVGLFDAKEYALAGAGFLDMYKSGNLDIYSRIKDCILQLNNIGQQDKALSLAISLLNQGNEGALGLVSNCVQSAMSTNNVPMIRKCHLQLEQCKNHSVKSEMMCCAHVLRDYEKSNITQLSTSQLVGLIKVGEKSVYEYAKTYMRRSWLNDGGGFNDGYAIAYALLQAGETDVMPDMIQSTSVILSAGCNRVDRYPHIAILLDRGASTIIREVCDYCVQQLNDEQGYSDDIISIAILLIKYGVRDIALIIVKGLHSLGSGSRWPFKTLSLLEELIDIGDTDAARFVVSNINNINDIQGSNRTNNLIGLIAKVSTGSKQIYDYFLMLLDGEYYEQARVLWQIAIEVGILDMRRDISMFYNAYIERGAYSHAGDVLTDEESLSLVFDAVRCNPDFRKYILSLGRLDIKIPR